MASFPKKNQRVQPSGNERDHDKSGRHGRNPPRKSTSADQDAADARRPPRRDSVDTVNSQDKSGVVYELKSPREEPSRNSQDIADTMAVAYPLFSGPVRYAPKEADGEVLLWRDEYEFFCDAVRGGFPSDDDDVPIEREERTDEFMSQVADCLALGRGEQLILDPENTFLRRAYNKRDPNYSKILVPAAPKMLSGAANEQPSGRQASPGAPATEGRIFTPLILQPYAYVNARPGALEQKLPPKTSTLIQKFAETPTTRWLSNGPIQLHTQVDMCGGMLFWARMMIVNPEDSVFLKRADILRGVMASLYRCRVDPCLVAAFLTYWNIHGHTLITAQGEMGYPLHTIHDAMGIPISGRLYEEYIPLLSTARGHVRTLYSIYADLCPVNMSAGPGLVTISAWVNNFFEDPNDDFKLSSKKTFASRLDPLFKAEDLRVEVREGRRTLVVSDMSMSYRVIYPSVVYRAAFIAAWLCTYCVPVEEGQYIRPEVFVMAVKLAKGNRRAIGVASMAFLYRSLDEAHNDIVTGASPANECSLFIPGHFIMGWYASFMKNIEPTASLTCTIPHAPFVIDFRRREPMSLIDALSLFWEFDDTGEGLRSLDFLGKSIMRFPKAELRLQDDRVNRRVHKAITIAAVDLLISCTVGGVTHRRGENFDNQVYCPHRFARMFNYDQAVPATVMPASNDVSTNSLDFDSYLSNSRKESLHILARRHLAFLRPEGHILFVHPFSRRTRRTLSYIRWCRKAFPFLEAPDAYCSLVEAPQPTEAASSLTPVVDDTGKEVHVNTTYKPSSSNQQSNGQPDAGESRQATMGKASLNPANEPPKTPQEQPSETSAATETVLDECPHGTPSSGAFQGPTMSLPEGAERNDDDMIFDELYNRLYAPDDDIRTVSNHAFSDGNLDNFLGSWGDPTTTDYQNNVPPGRVSSGNKSTPQSNHLTAGDLASGSPKRRPSDLEEGENKRARTTHTAESIDEESKKIYESIARECKEHYEGAEMKLRHSSTSSNAADDIRNLPLSNEFNRENPVNLRDLADSPSAHCVSYVQADLRKLRNILSEYPVNKTSMASTITTVLTFWHRMFDNPPPEVVRLMKGLATLQAAYGQDASDLATKVASQREQVQQRASVVNALITKVDVACSSMGTISSTLEGQIQEKESSWQIRLSRITDVEAQIEALQTELRRLKEDSSLGDALAESKNCLSAHRQRVQHTVEFKSALQSLSSKDDDYLQELDQITKNFVDIDELGFSPHMYALHDFITACASQAD